MVFCPWHNSSPLSFQKSIPISKLGDQASVWELYTGSRSNKKWETEGVCSNVPEKAVATNVTSQCRGRSEVLPSLSIIFERSSS